MILDLDKILDIKGDPDPLDLTPLFKTNKPKPVSRQRLEKLQQAEKTMEKGKKVTRISNAFDLEQQQEPDYYKILLDLQKEPKPIQAVNQPTPEKQITPVMPQAQDVKPTISNAFNLPEETKPDFNRFLIERLKKDLPDSESAISFIEKLQNTGNPQALLEEFKPENISEKTTKLIETVNDLNKLFPDSKTDINEFSEAVKNEPIYQQWKEVVDNKDKTPFTLQLVKEANAVVSTAFVPIMKIFELGETVPIIGEQTVNYAMRNFNIVGAVTSLISPFLNPYENEQDNKTLQEQLNSLIPIIFFGLESRFKGKGLDKKPINSPEVKKELETYKKEVTENYISQKFQLTEGQKGQPIKTETGLILDENGKPKIEQVTSETKGRYEVDEKGRVTPIKETGEIPEARNMETALMNVPQKGAIEMPPKLINIPEIKSPPEPQKLLPKNTQAKQIVLDKIKNKVEELSQELIDANNEGKPVKPIYDKLKQYESEQKSLEAEIKEVTEKPEVKTEIKEEVKQPVKTEPVKETSTKETETSGVLETPVQEKSIKQLEQENKYTAPKIPSEKVFSNSVEVPKKELTDKVNKYIDSGTISELPKEKISIDNIVPTQKNLTIDNLKKTQDVIDSKEDIVFLKDNGKYYILDGHHRIANDILKGKKEIEGYYYETKQVEKVTPRRIKQEETPIRRIEKEETEGKKEKPYIINFEGKEYDLRENKNKDILQKRFSELREKLTTKKGERRKKINPEDEAKFKELQEIGKKYDRFVKEESLKESIENSTKKLDEFGLKEGDSAILNVYGENKKVTVKLDREGNIQVGESDRYLYNPTPDLLKRLAEAKTKEKRVISNESYQQAKKNIGKLPDNISSNPIDFYAKKVKDLTIIGSYHLENGLRDFGKWSKKMIEDVGEWVRPYLRRVWDNVNKAVEKSAEFLYDIKPEDTSGTLGLYGGVTGKGYKKANRRGMTFEGKYDKKQRYEIDDSRAEFVKQIKEGYIDFGDLSPESVKYAFGRPLELNDILIHKELYKSYPQAKKIKVKFIGYSDLKETGYKGLYNSEKNEITIPYNSLTSFLKGSKESLDEVKSTLLHEIQHAIQKEEGFARGTDTQSYIKITDKRLKEINDRIETLEEQIRNTEEFQNAQRINNDFFTENKNKYSSDDVLKAEREFKNTPIGIEIQELFSERQKLLRDKYTEQKAYDYYKKHAGEIESRDVQARKDLTKIERRKIKPYSSENIPTEEAIVTFRGDNSASVSPDILKRKNESLSEYRQRIEKLREKKEEIKEVEKPKEETPRRISTTSYTQAETKFLDKLENVKNKPLSERMKIATQENLNKVKDFPFKSKVGNVFNAAKNKGKALWVGYKSPPRATDINISVREWTGAKNEISKVVMDMQESIKKKVPDRDTRRGMKAYIEANGNMELLKKWETEALLDKNKRKYRQAQNLTADEIKIANDIKQWYDDKLKMAQDYEVIEEGVENYVNRKWKKKNTVTEGIKNDFVYNSVLKTNFESARKRVFETEFEGEQLKYETISDDLVDNIGWYSQGLDNVINNRNYIKNLTYGKASDGRPLVAPTGFGKTIEGKTNEIGFINPNIKTGNTSDYISLNHPALKQWKWATTVDGNPVFAKVDLAVHPEIYKKLRNNLGESAMRDIPVYKQLRDVQKQIKGLIFTLSPFHIVQEGTHAVGHEINPFSRKLPEFDPKNKQHRKAVNSGLQLYDYNAMESMSEGLSVTNLGRKFPGAAYLQDLTFKTVIPKLKLATWEKMYEHNTKIYGKKYSDAEISMLTSDQVNAAYGHLNYKAMFRNPTIQDIFRFTTLAPDFLEARTRFLGQALRPTGVRQLKALGILAGTMYISARVLNQVINGDMYLDDPRMIFAVKIDDRVYDMRSVPGDLWELIEDPRRFLANRLSPMTKGIIESLTQKDYAGRPVDFSETVKDLAMTFIPSIIKGRLDMTFAQNLLSNFGFRNKKYRTPIEAEINKEYWQYNPPGKRTDSSKEKSEVLNEVRKLKLNGQLEEAEKLYTESQDKGLLGKKDYDDFLKDLDKGEYVNKFKQLPAEVQRELITDMEQPEIEKYFEGMKLEVRKDFYDTMPEGVKTLYYPDTFRKKSEKIIEKQSESYKYMDAMSKTNEGEKPKEVRRPKSTKPKSKKPYEKKY